jgi:outer membrane murein-binding lipoprotein Lpp
MSGAIVWLSGLLAHGADRIVVDRDTLDRQIADLALELDDLRDRVAAAEARDRRAEARSEALPIEVVERLHEGEAPVRVYREFRGLDVAGLARACALDPLDLGAIEAGARPGTFDEMRRISAALRVDMEDLVPWSDDPSAR